MELRRLGRLGHMSSVLIFGGASLADVSNENADESIALALESGINHFDSSDDYGDSEVHLGRWMPRIRDDVFIATKTTVRTKQGAAATIRRSLERLRVDHIDLLQIHAVGNSDDLDRVTGPGGALEAAIAARDEGLVRGIGITGHGVDATKTHIEALRRFDFDTVLTPYSWRLCRDDDFRDDFEALTETAQQRDVGVMLIKYMARNLWRDDEEPRYATWYEPLDDQRLVDAAVAFALRRTDVTGICTAGDVRLLPKIIQAQRRAATMDAAEVDAILQGVDGLESPFIPSRGRSIPTGI
jgi:aryl-alcohol dehydrogenase-like predicted oxidoreductase